MDILDIKNIQCAAQSLFNYCANVLDSILKDEDVSNLTDIIKEQSKFIQHLVNKDCKEKEKKFIKSIEVIIFSNSIIVNEVKLPDPPINIKNCNILVKDNNVYLGNTFVIDLNELIWKRMI